MKQFIQQEIISFHGEIFRLTGDHFVQQEIISLHFFRMYISWEVHDSRKNFAWDPMILWEAGSPGISHPVIVCEKLFPFKNDILKLSFFFSYPCLRDIL